MGYFNFVPYSYNVQASTDDINDIAAFVTSGNSFGNFRHLQPLWLHELLILVLLCSFCREIALLGHIFNLF